MTVHRPPDSKISIEADYRRALVHIAEEAARIAATATRIVETVGEVTQNGGTVNIQAQMNFLTGAHARLLKDLGVIEALQGRGAVATRRLLTAVGGRRP